MRNEEGGVLRFVGIGPDIRLEEAPEALPEGAPAAEPPIQQFCRPDVEVSREIKSAEEEELDVRFSRSYFFVPFLDEEFFQWKRRGSGGRPVYDRALKRLRDYFAEAEAAGRPVTDVVVMAHGWHRNLFSSIAAYDRLSAIYLDLWCRACLDPLRGSPDSEEFHPAVIGVHFHSDTGANEWVDYSGRRYLYD